MANFAPTQISSFLFTISLLVAAYYIYSIANLRRLFNLKTIQFEDLKIGQFENVFAPTKTSNFKKHVILSAAKNLERSNESTLQNGLRYFVVRIARLNMTTLFNSLIRQFEDLKMLLRSKQRHSERSEESLRRQKLQTSDFKLLKKTGSVGNNAVAVPSTSTAAYHSYCANYSNLILPVSNCGKLPALFFFLQQIFNSLTRQFDNLKIIFSQKKEQFNKKTVQRRQKQLSTLQTFNFTNFIN